MDTAEKLRWDALLARIERLEKAVLPQPVDDDAQAETDSAALDALRNHG